MADEEINLRICRHGSLWCACRHNLVSAQALPGRPKYPPRKLRAKVNNKGKGKGAPSTLVLPEKR